MTESEFGEVPTDPTLIDTLMTERIEVARLQKRKLNAEILELERRNLQDDADSYNNRIYSFVDIVTPDSVETAVETISEWDRLSPGSPFTVILSTPGGSIFEGLGFYDFLRYMSDTRGHEITTIGQGRVFSMGSVLLQAGDQRFMTPHSYLMVHEGSTVSIGKQSDIEDEAKLLKRLQERMVKILSERSSLTEAKIKNRWKRKDWWMDASQALEWGFIDKIT